MWSGATSIGTGLVTKDEARREVLKRWRALPTGERKTFAQATAFALAIDPTIEFETMGSKPRMIAAWLQRDLLELAAAADARRVRAGKVSA